MIETYHLGTYWGPRQEDAQACAERMAHMVRLLESEDPLFARWFKCVKSLKESLKRPLDSDIEGLRKHVQSRIMRDSARKPIPDLGFRVPLWNGGTRVQPLWTQSA
jgi:hypothetical protein